MPLGADAIDSILAALGDEPAAAERVALVLGRGDALLDAALQPHDRVRVEHASGDWPSLQLPRRFTVVLVGRDLIDGAGAAAVMHCAVQHAAPGAHLVVTTGDARALDDLRRRFALVAVAAAHDADVTVSLLRRPERHTIHDMVFAARAGLERVDPEALALRIEREPTLLVVDTRTPTDRERFGVIPGSIHVPRTVLEWHLDPANGYR
ncbi:MAG: hypothetical protein WBP59_06470, partial [Ilumatobacteraceae bacterium]